MATNAARMPLREDTASAPRPRVLVVDDDHQIRQLVCRFLTRYRYEVSPAENGREALEMFRSAPYDAVVTDLYMPVMDGPTLMGRIRNMAPGTPILVITGQHGALEGMDLLRPEAILYKPFDLFHLETTLRGLLPPHVAAGVGLPGIGLAKA